MSGVTPETPELKFIAPLNWKDGYTPSEAENPPPGTEYAIRYYRDGRAVFGNRPAITRRSVVLPTEEANPAEPRRRVVLPTEDAK